MLTLPNLVTFARLGLLPVILWAIHGRDHHFAFWLFIAAGLGDALDGYLARRLGQFSALGALLDPVADKLTMLGVGLLLMLQGLLPAWLFAAVVLRDLVIVGGALAYRLLRGRLEMAPTRLSKLNTALEFLLFALVLAVAGGAPDDWLRPLTMLVCASVAASGTQYVWLWGRKAWQEGKGS